MLKHSNRKTLTYEATLQQLSKLVEKESIYKAFPCIS